MRAQQLGQTVRGFLHIMAGARRIYVEFSIQTNLLHQTKILFQ